MIKIPKYSSDRVKVIEAALSGAAMFFYLTTSRKWVKIIASEGMGWEHVSASFQRRIPTWYEMNEIKEFFWEPGDWVVQFHPAKSEYKNDHPHCLSLATD